MSTRPDPAEQSVHAAIATDLVSGGLPPARAAALLGPLLQRVQHSKAAHADYLTVRREDGAWRAAGDGVRTRWLRADDCVEIDLVGLDPGALLPPPGDAVAQEWLLMEGRLAPAADGSADLQLPPLSHAVVSGSAPAPAMRAASACLLYCRTLRHPAWLPPDEAAWWAEAQRSAGWRTPGRDDWGPDVQGVRMLPLCSHRQVASMLVRMEASARGADHGHALNEDCLVLHGDMYLGDILLRAGDYQLAPAGGTHFDIASDDGALFYFHGALDPAVFGELP